MVIVGTMLDQTEKPANIAAFQAAVTESIDNGAGKFLLAMLPPGSHQKKRAAFREAVAELLGTHNIDDISPEADTGMMIQVLATTAPAEAEAVKKAGRFLSLDLD